MKYQDIIKFWFQELEKKDWWKKSNELDKLIKKRFLSCYESVVKGETFKWRETSEGALAEIIVIDQFSRNMFRDKPEAFQYDNLALILAQEAVAQGKDQSLEISKRAFMYMPYMHSESKVIHEEAVKLFDQEGLEFNLDFEHKHKKIIDKFGRYPHRNEILSRNSTDEELEFLKQPNSSF